MKLADTFKKITTFELLPHDGLPRIEYPLYVSDETWTELQNYPLRMSEFGLIEYILYNFNDLEKDRTFDIDRIQNLAAQAHYTPIPVRLMPNNVIAVGQDTIDWCEQNSAPLPPAPSPTR